MRGEFVQGVFGPLSSLWLLDAHIDEFSLDRLLRRQLTESWKIHPVVQQLGCVVLASLQFSAGRNRIAFRRLLPGQLQMLPNRKKRSRRKSLFCSSFCWRSYCFVDIVGVRFVCWIDGWAELAALQHLHDIPHQIMSLTRSFEAWTEAWPGRPEARTEA